MAEKIVQDEMSQNAKEARELSQGSKSQEAKEAEDLGLRKGNIVDFNGSVVSRTPPTEALRQAPVNSLTQAVRELSE